MSQKIQPYLKFIFAAGLLFSFFFTLGLSRQADAQCTPTNITVCSSDDDIADIWINSTYIGNYQFANINLPGSPPCISIANPPFLNTAGSNVIAVRNQNTNPDQMWASWTADITCMGGQHAYVTSDDSPVSMFNTPNNPSAAATPTGTGANWYDLSFAPSGWTTAADVTATIYGKQLYNPKTGLPVSVLAMDSTGDSADPNQYLWFRQLFTINPQNPPPPPAMTISETVLGPTSQINANQPVTHVLTVCNTGTADPYPVTIAANFDPKFGYGGPYSCPTNNTVDGPCYYNGSTSVTILFPSGLPGLGACESVTYSLIDYSIQPADYCDVTNSDAQVSYNNGASTANTFGPPVTLLCPGTPTQTSTPTVTKTPTPSNTPTSTKTFTPTRTFTSTHTPLFTPTITHTPTSTKTPTVTFSPTHTPTITQTPTITDTPTITNTPTITDTPGPNVDIFYVSKNLFTASDPVSIHVEYSHYPGPYSLMVYNTAGELVKKIVPAQTADNYITLSTTWDGTNDHGEPCASGVYILYLIEPYNVKIKKVVLIHQ